MDKISVIIPLHNGERIIKNCLEGIYSQSIKPHEVIVVDDCSTDKSLEIACQFPCKILKLEKNSGPAVARNLGAKESSGEILFFVDVDAVLKKDALERTLQNYKENSDVACVCGTFSKFSGGSGWTDKFRNLQVFWWHNQDKMEKKFITIFMVTGGSIKRDVFFEMGGFNTDYADADVEDYEMGHRIVKKHKILFDKNIQFDHNHYRSPFGTLLKKLYKRSKMWAPLSMKRGGFETNYATKNRGIGAAFAMASLISLALIPIFAISVIPFLVFFAMFILTDMGFYKFLHKEEGPVFLFYSIFVYYIITIVMSAGAGVGVLNYYLKK